jgi:hypothetical protein
MRLESYSMTIDEHLLTFDFVSEGTKGSIKKRIEYQSTKRKEVFNLAFGDVDPITNELDDTIISDNGDSEKVLATVAFSIFLFMELYPENIVFATGSTPSRTRLYKIGISKNLEELTENFLIYGFDINEKWQKYNKNEVYSAFYVKSKNNIL